MATTQRHDARAAAKAVVEKLRAAGHQALWAGGCVRDMLLGIEPKDYDVATDANPEQVRKLFRRTFAVGEAFGVIRVLYERGVEIEVATFRIDADYSDGRRPNAVVFCSAEEDARRRDLTINGVFFDPIAETYIDYVGGEKDLRAGVIRAIGDPIARFCEDKLRLLRTVRFAARLNFAIDTATAAAMRAMASQLGVVSAERILAEVRMMLEPPTRQRALELLAEHNLATGVFGELQIGDDWNAGLRRVAQLPAREFPLAMVIAVLFSKLPAEASAGVVERLRGSNEERQQTAWLATHRQELDGAPSWPAHRLKRLFAKPGIRDLFEVHAAISRADGNTGAVAANRWAAAEYARLSPEEVDPPPLATGDDLIALGFAPGPKFKEVLDTIRDAQLDGKISQKAEAAEIARQCFGAPA